MRAFLRPSNLRTFHRTTRLVPTPTRLAAYSSSPFQPGPSPPRLPPDEQAEFERLQHQAATGPISSSAQAGTPEAAAAAAATGDAAKTRATSEAKVVDDVDGVVGIRRGAPPEFEGDVNPLTGEVGGPKNEPLRWGAKGDYSFNGRVTDF